MRANTLRAHDGYLSWSQLREWDCHGNKPCVALEASPPSTCTKFHFDFCSIPFLPYLGFCIQVMVNDLKILAKDTHVKGSLS